MDRSIPSHSTAADVATAWAIAKVTTPIIGVTKPNHIDGLIRASSITLTSDNIAELEALAAATNVNTWLVEKSNVNLRHPGPAVRLK